MSRTKAVLVTLTIPQALGLHIVVARGWNDPPFDAIERRGIKALEDAIETACGGKIEPRFSWRGPGYIGRPGW